MPLQQLTSEPVYMTAEEHMQLQEATPSSFSGHAPVLRLKLDGVRCSIQSQDAVSLGEPSGSSPPRHNGNGGHMSAQQGTLWITESHVSFLPVDGRGFTLDYPSLSLHAVSRTLPDSLASISSSLPSTSGCLYCQLDNSKGEEEDEEDDSPVSELWILPAEQDSLEPLFETLSYCASLHPSQNGEDDEGGGHPFAGVGPFGTGTMGEMQDQAVTDGAFDDADEDGEVGDVHLTETGRATLAHLDALLESPHSMPASLSSANTRGSMQARAATTEPTNSLILVHLPDEIFTHPPLAASLLDLLHAFGELASWTPLPSFGRALIVYEVVQGARRAKEALDWLPLIEEGGMDEDDARPEKGPTSYKLESKNVLRAYFGPQTTLPLHQHGDGMDHLEVPTTDRNFLISPPGSPPVGWEPIKEDPPNRETLADDLIRALGSLRDKGLGVQGHHPRPLREAQTTKDAACLPPPSLVIEPSRATVRSRHPLTRRSPGEPDEETISVPGVVVQSMDCEDDEEDGALHERANKGLSISSVKATIESMQHHERITPTGRPPLG